METTLETSLSSDHAEPSHGGRNVWRLRAADIDEVGPALLLEGVTLPAPHGAVTGEVSQERGQLDLGPVLRRQSREAVLPLSTAPRASEPDDDVGV